MHSSSFTSLLPLFVQGPLNTLHDAVFGENAAANAVCEQLRTTGNLSVAFPGDSLYEQHTKHWAPSSSQPSVCSVVPSSAAEVSEVIRAIGQHRSPFAVKGGGHATNPSFSSSPGIQISMAGFREVAYHTENSSVRVGAGLLGEEVFAALEPFNVTVPAPRLSGVGVAGFTLGGGFSWTANEVGLAADNLVEIELVTPFGDVINVTEYSHPDLFFAVRGGWNNFGIVTTLTFKAHPQTDVVAGAIFYAVSEFDAFTHATSNFASKVTDTKAQVIPIITTTNATGTMLSALLFYNAPEVPSGIFDEFLAVPSVINDFKRRSMVDLMSTARADGIPGAGLRIVSDTVGLKEHPTSLLEQMRNQSEHLVAQGAIAVNLMIEPLMDAAFSRSTFPAAHPYSASLPLRPLCTSVFWESAEDDAHFLAASEEMIRTIYEYALRDGQDIDAKEGKQIRYGNYASWRTPPELVWGANLERLRSIKRTVDPDDIMSLAGGWKL